MALEDKIPKIISFIKYEIPARIEYSETLSEVFEGDLKKHLIESINIEVKEINARTVMANRAIPINILKQVTNKLSDAYNANIIRETEDVDQEVLDFWIEEANLNVKLNQANKQLNLQGYHGLEPYIDNGKPALRVLEANMFFPYSDDLLDLSRMTVAIKAMSTYMKTVDKKQVETNIYYIYDENEVLIIDNDGDILRDLMIAANIEEGFHGLGIIPIIYVNSSNSRLLPVQDTSKLDISLSISKKLTDLSYASLYFNHARIYTLDVDMQNPKADPSFILNCKSDGEEGKSGSIGVLQATVNILDTLQLCNSEVSMLLSSLGLTPGQAEQGANSTASVASGIAKMIDESGAEQVTKEQRAIYQAAEAKLWKLIGKLHNSYVDKNLIEETKRVGDKFAVKTTFEEKKASESETVVIERAKLKLDSGFTTKIKALALVNPDLDDDELKALQAEIDAEKIVIPLEEKEEVISGAE